LEGNGALGSGGAAVLIGNMYGVGAKNCLSIPASIPGNNWYDRPLTVNKTAGAGEAGIGIVNHVTAWVGQWQLYNTGAQYLGSVNADNSGHIEVTSSKFNTVSARIFKDEIQALRERIASPLERLVRLAPIYHRDLQPALANAAEVPVSDPMDPTKTVLRRAEPQPAMYRFGLVAEDVAAVLPEVVGMSQLGPTLDTHGIVSFLVGCVQELAEQVKGLQQQVVELGGKA
jgi:hypothetical protein